MSLRFAPGTKDATDLHVIDADQLPDWLAVQPDHVVNWLAANDFKAGIGEALLVPGTDGVANMAVAGIGTATQRNRGRFALAAAAATLPAGTYQLARPIDAVETEALGWLLSGYKFDRYKAATQSAAALIAPEGIDAHKVETLAAGEALTRDLINTPASDMGPDELEEAARSLASEQRADIAVIAGDALVEQNFPMIHTVGRAAGRTPRLIDMAWGQSGPQVTLVGKGVCFDTGGLNLKPGSSMGLMKKDMGGAANVLGLATMIMTLELPLQLRVLIPAVENAVAGDAYRPGDILTARNGLTVEVNNTDAEGRLVLADALAYASEAQPDLIVSMATLTGAARVAVGPDLAPFYTDDEDVAAALSRAGQSVADPVWRLPFHAPYEAMIEPGIADLDNAPKGGFAGSITAALFLRRFVDGARYTHFDIYGWQPKPAPARPMGGAGQGARAILDALPGLLGL